MMLVSCLGDTQERVPWKERIDDILRHPGFLDRNRGVLRHLDKRVGFPFDQLKDAVVVLARPSWAYFLKRWSRLGLYRLTFGFEIPIGGFCYCSTVSGSVPNLSGNASLATL